MKYQVIGLNTRNVYLEGTKPECYRGLIEKYPSKNRSTRSGSTVRFLSLMPEPMQVMKVMGI